MRNCCYDVVCSAARSASAPTGGGERRGISWRPPAYSLFYHLAYGSAVAPPFLLAQTHYELRLATVNTIVLRHDVFDGENLQLLSVRLMCGDVEYIIIDVCVMAIVEWQINLLLLLLLLLFFLLLPICVNK